MRTNSKGKSSSHTCVYRSKYEVRVQNSGGCTRLKSGILRELSVDDRGSNSGMEVALSLTDEPPNAGDAPTAPCRFDDVEAAEFGHSSAEVRSCDDIKMTSQWGSSTDSTPSLWPSEAGISAGKMAKFCCVACLIFRHSETCFEFCYNPERLTVSPNARGNIEGFF